MTRVSKEVLAGQYADVIRPQSGATSRLFVFCHGGGLNFEYASTFPGGTSTYAQLQETLYYIAERNYVVVCPAVYDTLLPAANFGDTYGNNGSTTQLAAVITAIKAGYGVSQGKYVVGGVSLGNLTALNHARRAGLSGIAGIFGQAPLGQMNLYRGTDAAPGIGYALFNQCFSKASDLNKTITDTVVTSEILPVYGALAIAATVTVPLLYWTQSNDTFAPPADAVAVAAAVPNGKGVAVSRGLGDVANSGHDFTTMTGKDLHAWLDSLAWG